MYNLPKSHQRTTPRTPTRTRTRTHTCTHHLFAAMSTSQVDPSPPPPPCPPTHPPYNTPMLAVVDFNLKHLFGQKSRSSCEATGVPEGDANRGKVASSDRAEMIWCGVRVQGRGRAGHQTTVVRVHALRRGLARQPVEGCQRHRLVPRLEGECLFGCIRASGKVASPDRVLLCCEVKVECASPP